jgi:arylsulfatase A-like enzyme
MILFLYSGFFFIYFKAYKFNRLSEVAETKFKEISPLFRKELTFIESLQEYIQIFFNDIILAFIIFLFSYFIFRVKKIVLKQIFVFLFSLAGVWVIALAIVDSQVYKKFGVALNSELISFFFSFPGELMRSNVVTSESIGDILRPYRYFSSIAIFSVLFIYLTYQNALTRKWIKFLIYIRLKIKLFIKFVLPYFKRTSHSKIRLSHSLFLFFALLLIILLPFQLGTQIRPVDGLESNFLFNIGKDLYIQNFHPSSVKSSFLQEYSAKKSWFKAVTGLDHLQAGKTNIYIILLESTSYKWFSSPKHSGILFPFLSKLGKRDDVIRVNRFYCPIPRSSKARAMIFTGTYIRPDGYFSKDESYIPVNLARFLRNRGYSAVYLHTCDLEFDHQYTYFTSLGFDVNDGKWFEKRLQNKSEAKIGWGYDDVKLIDPGFTDILKLNRKKFGAKSDKPLFTVFSFIGPHHPYTTPRHFKTKFPFKAGGEKKQYFKSIVYQDRLSEKFFRLLEKEGELKNSLIIVMGDHGESFGEHGYRIHNFSIFNEEVQVPFYMLHPDFKKSKIKTLEMGSHLDIFATILDMFNLTIDEKLHGFSIFNQKQERTVYLHSWTRPINMGFISGRKKYGYNNIHKKLKIFDLVKDPFEKHPIIPETEDAAPVIKRIKRSRSAINTFHRENHQY